MKIGNRIFDTEHDCYIMGILNVTPDSFSDGGKWNDMERAKQHAADMIAEGLPLLTWAESLRVRDTGRLPCRRKSTGWYPS